MKKISIIILNWNGRKTMQQFLPSVVEHTPNTIADIIVADNGSTDDSVNWLKENYQDIILMPFQQNYGFAEGYNIAIGRVHTEFVVLLNSDVEVTANWLDEPLNCMAANSKVVACQPKILAFRNKSEFEYAGACGGYIDALGYPFCRGRILDAVETDSNQYNTKAKIFWASGACLFVRRVDYIDYGGLDVNFFAHQEEIDLCWRFNARGRDVVVVPESVVYHYGGASLSETNPHKTYLNFRNNLFLLYNNLTSVKFILIFFIRFFLDYIAALVFLLKSDKLHAKAVVKARLDFYKAKSKFKKKRKENIEKTIRYKIPSVYKSSVLLGYYLFNKKKFSQLTSFSKSNALL